MFTITGREEDIITIIGNMKNSTIGTTIALSMKIITMKRRIIKNSLYKMPMMKSM